MNPEDIREFLNNWALLLIALLGLIAAYEKASKQIMRWIRNLNLYGRIHRVEREVDELSAIAHVHDEGTQ